ncbi:MAG TPA: ankyrin repeat domain-containing protein, partial [Gemmatimonadaceae bacterium]
IVHARGELEPPYGYFTGATLLHFVAWNPSRSVHVPPNIVDIARLLLDRGADVNAVTLAFSNANTMGLVVTSRMASEANASGPLIELLRERGSPLDLDTSDLYVPLANHAPRAGEKMIQLGAKPDVCVAAALGRMDLLEGFFSPDGRLQELPRRNGELLSERDAIGLALLFAYVNKRREAVDFLLEKDGNWNMTGVNNGGVLHRAAFDGDLEMVKRLVAKGADMSNRDNPFNSTPVSWASHNAQQEVVDWMRANCRIDIHEAVGHNMYEQVEARLREDPASVNLRLDHWNIPQSTPLYWAAWTMMETGHGVVHYDEADRVKLVRLLLDHGADPNIVAGDGHTALDVATTAKAPNVVALIKDRGGKRSSEV